MADKPLTASQVVDAIKGFTPKQKEEVNKALGNTGDRPSASGTGMSEKQLERQNEYNKALMRTAELVGNVGAARKAEFEMLEDTIASNKDLRKIMEGLNISMQDLREGEIEGLNIENDLLNEQINKYQDLWKLQEGQKKFGQDQKDLLNDIAGAIGVNVKMENTFLGSVAKVSEGLLSQGETQEQAMKAMTANFKSIFNWQNITLSIFTKIAEATMKLVREFDNARAGLAAATGTGYEFQDVLFQSQREANLLGISMGEASDAVKVLFDSTTNFVKVSQEAQAEMITTTAMLSKLGIDGGTAAETFQFLNLNLGLTATEATRAQKSLAMMGTKLGISSAKITKDFNNALPILAVYGKQSVEVFSNLAAAAKTAGVETSALLGIAKQFDTFSGAAEGFQRYGQIYSNGHCKCSRY